LYPGRKKQNGELSGVCTDATGQVNEELQNMPVSIKDKLRAVCLSLEKSVGKIKDYKLVTASAGAGYLRFAASHVHDRSVVLRFSLRSWPRFSFLAK